MRKKFQRIPSRAAEWSLRCGWLSLILLVVGCAGQRLLLLTINQFFIVMGCVALLGGGALIFAFKGFIDLWQRGDKGGIKSIKGLILSFISLCPIFAAYIAYFIFPPFYDISTDSTSPPQLVVNKRPNDALPVHKSLYYEANEQFAFWPQLSGRRYDGSPDKILPAVISVMEGFNWQVIAQSGTVAEDNVLYVEGVANTPILGFMSDVVIRLNDEGDTTFVDMRSTSRYLTHDLGINARFILNFMVGLDTKVLLAPSDQSEE